ncbi:MAG: replication factor C large subunit [Candidatus Thorarchaeota archaeon]
MSVRKIPWTERYRPRSLNQLVGNEAVVKDFLKWIKSWEQGIPKKRGILLVGPSGTGKTAIVGAVANDLGFEVVEFNASDKRNKESIETQVARSALQQTLDGRPRIILLDEVDGLSGTSDRGGVGAILKIIENSAHPIVMTANDPQSSKLKDISRKCHVLSFEPLDDDSMLRVLQMISEDSQNKVSLNLLESIIKNAGGDLRAAISDFEALTEGRIDDAEISLGTRDVRRSIVQTLRRMFMLTDETAARVIVSETDVDHDSLLLWLEENIHLHLSTPSELEEGFEALSMADLYLGRIMRQQNWKLLSYVYDFLSVGVVSSRRKTPYRRVEYTEPIWPLLIWKGNMKREKKAELISKMALAAGISMDNAYEKCVRVVESIIEISPRQLMDFERWLSVNRSAFGHRDNRS